MTPPPFLLPSRFKRTVIKDLTRKDFIEKNIYFTKKSFNNLSEMVSATDLANTENKTQVLMWEKGIEYLENTSVYVMMEF